MAYKILVTVPFTEEQKAVFREAAVGFQDEIIFTHDPKEIEEGGAKTLCWSIMLESAYEFDALYKASIEWLMK